MLVPQQRVFTWSCLNHQGLLQVPAMGSIFRNRENPVEANGNDLTSEGKLLSSLGPQLLQADMPACPWPLRIP